MCGSAAVLPFIGSGVHIIQKILFEMSGMSKGSPMKFRRPLFFTWLGSLGLFCVFIFDNTCKFDKSRFKLCFSKKYRRSFFMLAFSTFFNLVAGTLSNLSSLYLNYSLSLMLRSSTLLFGALITVFYKKEKLLSCQKRGLLITVLALTVVSLSAFIGGSSSAHVRASNGKICFFVIIRILSKSLQAISVIIEENVVKSGITPRETTGLSGIWSILFSSLVLFLPFEDLSETISLLSSSKPILLLSLLSAFIFALYNISALTVSNRFSGMVRILYDQLTIIVVWVIQVMLYLLFKGTEYQNIGEKPTKGSIVQLLGFIMMVYGAVVYQSARAEDSEELLL